MIREIACFAEINFHSLLAESPKRNFSFFISIASPLLWTTSRRTGKSPASCRFDSNNCCVSSSVSKGEARNESEPTLTLAAEAGMAIISFAGFTLKRELLQEMVSRANTKRAAAVARRRIGNDARLICLAGNLNWFSSRGQARTDVMQLRRIDHVQAVIANCLEARQQFINRRLHHALAALVS